MDPEAAASLSATEIARGVAGGTLRAEAVVEALLERIAGLEPTLRAWEVLDSDGALRRAREVDAAMGRGRRLGLLAGVPLGVKDIFDTADLPTRYGSPIHEGHRPAADADCVARARSEGVVVLGKTVTTEFAYFAPGPTANPRAPGHTPGGSSSGSAAAVAAGMVPVALGTQTAGSIIRPASYCGVFGFKPGYGTISLAGAHPLAPSLDTLGWLARTADDLELLRAAMLGASFEPLPALDPRDVRIGVSRTPEWPAIEPAGAAALDEAAARLAAAGARTVEVELPPPFERLVEAQVTIMEFEAARSLAPELAAHPELLSPVLRAHLDVGRAIGPDAYAAARDLADLGRAAFDGVIAGLDALLVPSAPGEAPAGLASTGNPQFDRTWSLLGVPCVNVPGLTGPAGLPVGVQLVAGRDAERRLLALAGTTARVLA